MEHTLGVPIFDRSPKGVEPTQYGRALLKRGIAAFDEIAQAVKDIDFLADPTVGELWIGTTPGLAEGIVLTVLDRLSRQYPRVVVHLVPGGLLFSTKHCASDASSLGSEETLAPVRRRYRCRNALRRTVGRCGELENPWARRRKIKLAELVNEPWTWPEVGTVIDYSLARSLSGQAGSILPRDDLR